MASATLAHQTLAMDFEIGLGPSTMINSKRERRMKQERDYERERDRQRSSRQRSQRTSMQQYQRTSESPMQQQNYGSVRQSRQYAATGTGTPVQVTPGQSSLGRRREIGGIRIKHSVLMGRARPIKTLCFMRIEWLKFDDYVPARITKKSLGFVPFLGRISKSSEKTGQYPTSAAGRSRFSYERSGSIRSGDSKRGERERISQQSKKERISQQSKKERISQQSLRSGRRGALTPANAPQRTPPPQSLQNKMLAQIAARAHAEHQERVIRSKTDARRDIRDKDSTPKELSPSSRKRSASPPAAIPMDDPDRLSAEMIRRDIINRRRGIDSPPSRLPGSDGIDSPTSTPSDIVREQREPPPLEGTGSGSCL